MFLHSELKNRLPFGRRFFCERLATAAIVVASATVIGETVTAAAHKEKDYDKNPRAVTAEISVTHSVNPLSSLQFILCEKGECGHKFFTNILLTFPDFRV